MIGVEPDVPQKDVRVRLINDEHCFKVSTPTNIVRLLPPLILTIEEADDFVERFEKMIGTI